MEFKPHGYQETAKKWILEHDKCGLSLDMGLGKTVTSLTAEDTWPTDKKGEVEDLKKVRKFIDWMVEESHEEI